MNYIKGKYRSSIFESETGYKVGLFKVGETDHEEIMTNKTLTFTGYFSELNADDTYIFRGEYVYNERYGHQFQTKEYERVVPEGKEAIIDFLTSSFVKGCGEKTAQKIFELYGEESLNKIKENKANLLLVQGLTEDKASKIYNSVVKYFDADEEILYLKNLGFSVKETMNLINIYEKNIRKIIENDIYQLGELIDFKRLDQIFLQTNNPEDSRRIKACIVQGMKNLTFSNGDVYLKKSEILDYLNYNYGLNLTIDDYLGELVLSKDIVVVGEDYYLTEDYLNELYSSASIAKLLNKKVKKITNFNKCIEQTEKDLEITYNEEQKNAIAVAIENNISIITGGPGTGKTTIIKGIIKAYSYIKGITSFGVEKNILLLAPTGRASKRLSEMTFMGSSTIHRFLKWDKERNIFGINEHNKARYDLVIIDETSMIDNYLLASLFRGLDITNTQFVFVGDEYQLPSVGPGLILNDLIASEVIPHIRLENIYRQSENSFIPLLAREIKEREITTDIKEKRDDYSFIETGARDIRNMLEQILEKSLAKGLDESTIQVLAPMYKGENGIDNLNVLLQSIFNPKKPKKNEVVIGNIIYREDDKVLNLVNDVDLNISNGDIGYIKEININSKSDYLVIDYDGNLVSYKKEMINTITHAYAISIHKSQGSEFNHVLMPISTSYTRMLYNKLLYTGVSRAKKSLVLIGSINAFNTSVHNNYSVIRKTTLKENILHNLNNNG